MDQANKFELHYLFLEETDHSIDALVRNKCEAELLAIITETALLLDIDSSPVSEAFKTGGFREIWKLVGSNTLELTLVVMVLQLIVGTVPLISSSDADLEKQLKVLSIEEKKLQIQKLKKELEGENYSRKSLDKAVSLISKSPKIIKRRSNLYSYFQSYSKIEKVGFTVLNSQCLPVSNELLVSNQDFRKFILTTNKLRSESDENAVIEIISPVLKEGRYKWKGIYDEKTINFDMLDSSFREEILLGNLPFRHGTSIKCILLTHRKLDEVGEVKITGYSVTTVLKKEDDNSSYETIGGKVYKQAKKLQSSQGDLFQNNG